MLAFFIPFETNSPNFLATSIIAEPSAFMPLIIASEIKFALIKSPSLSVFCPASFAESPNFLSDLELSSVAFSLSLRAFSLSLSSFSSLISSASALLSDIFQAFVFLSFSPYFSLDCSKAFFNAVIFSFCLSICSAKILFREVREEADLSFLENSAVTLPISEAITLSSEFICRSASLYAFSPSSLIVPPNVFEPAIFSLLL